MRLLEVKQPNIIVVYGGGFQPFHEGHASSYREAKAAFPGAHFFVAASNVTTERPFEFKEKQFLAQQAGVVDPFIQVGTMSYVNDNGRKVTSTPLNPLEVLQKFNPERDVLVIVRSERDPMKTTDTSYYQPWQGLQGAEPFSKHAYVFVTKKHDFSIAGNPVYSGSQVRELYSGADDKTKLSILQDLYPQSRQLDKIKKIFDKRLAVAESIDEDVDLSKYPIKVYQNKISGKFIAWVDIKNGDKIFPNVTADTAEAAKQGQIDQIESKISFKSGPSTGYSLTGLNKYFIKGMLGKRDDNPFWVQLKDKTLFVSEKPMDGFIKFDFDRRQKNHSGAFTANISNAYLNSAGLEPGTRYNISPMDVSGDIKSFKFDYHSRMEGTWDKLREPIPILGVQKTGRSKEVESIDVDEASLSTMRDFFAGDEKAHDPLEITKQRLYYDPKAVANKRKEFRTPYEYQQWLKKHNLKQITDSEEYNLEEEAANLLEYLRKIHKRWAIVSKREGRPLVYFKGDGKPSKDWVEKQERRINKFKHKK